MKGLLQATKGQILFPHSNGQGNAQRSATSLELSSLKWELYAHTGTNTQLFDLRNRYRSVFSVEYGQASIVQSTHKMRALAGFEAWVDACYVSLNDHSLPHLKPWRKGFPSLILRKGRLQSFVKKS